MSQLKMDLAKLTLWVYQIYIVLPYWTIPLYRADSHVREVEITRHIDVLGYPVPENARPISFLL